MACDITLNTYRRLFPLGGFDIRNGEVSYTEAFYNRGYTEPTQEEFDNAFSIEECNINILSQLRYLDTKVARSLEDLLSVSDYNYPTVALKRELRSQLRK